MITIKEDVIKIVSLHKIITALHKIQQTIFSNQTTRRLRNKTIIK
jgi:hypothetical protein